MNSFIDRTHPGTLTAGNLKWSIRPGADAQGLTSFFANGSTSTTIRGRRLVLQGDNVYALQLDGSWLVGNLWGKTVVATIKVDDPLAPQPVPQPLPTPVPVASAIVHPMRGLTNWVYADMALGVPWKKGGGDATSIGVNVSGTTADISGLPGDLIITGINSVASVAIDGKTVDAFWTDPTSNGSLALPSHYGRPVIVPNDAGRTLTIGGNGATWRVERLANPAAAMPLMVAGYRAPDLLRIDPTSFGAVVIPGSTPAASSDANRCFAGAREYLVDRGVPFVRGHCQASYYPKTGAGRVARCDYPLPPQPAMYVAYLLRLGPTVPAMVTDLGVKLTGMGGNEGRWSIGEHINTYYNRARNPRNGNIVALRDYYYSAEASAGQGAGDGQNSPYAFGFLPTDWVLIEHGAVANTPGNADGIKRTWINGNLVEDRAIRWFDSPTSRWTTMSLQVYHGGVASYAGDCWYDIGPFMASTQHIGVDPAFAALLG